jgi:hypothetical protein
MSNLFFYLRIVQEKHEIRSEVGRMLESRHKLFGHASLLPLVRTSAGTRTMRIFYIASILLQYRQYEL